MPNSDLDRFRANPLNGGEGNRPRPLPPVDKLFTVVMWLRDYGWTTVAWAMSRGDADTIAAAYLKKPSYTRSEVWRGGQMVAEQGRPADRPQPRRYQALPDSRPYAAEGGVDRG